MDYPRLRADLAAAFRWAARLGFEEAVANHFSVAVDDGRSVADGRSGADGRFLMNPRGRHFSRIRASELLLLDPADESAPRRADAPDATAWCLHAHLHREAPRARCVLHMHMPFATALASLADFRLLPIDQNACRFYDRVAYADDFGGMLLASEEARKVQDALGDKRTLVMRGHGVLVAAESAACAFDLLYYFERACKNQWLALCAGRELYRIPAEVAEKTARQWEEYEAVSAADHFNELKAILDAEGSDYRD